MPKFENSITYIATNSTRATDTLNLILKSELTEQRIFISVGYIRQFP